MKPGQLAPVAAWALLALPPLRHLMEASLLLHVVGQLPALGIAGWLLARCSHKGPVSGTSRQRRIGGVINLVAAGCVIGLWMLPRSLDAALRSYHVEVAKFLLLPLAGAAVEDAWRRLHPVAQVSVRAHVIAMLLMLGWLYLAAPFRLCNGYHRDAQDELGTAMLVAAAGLAGWWGGGVFRRTAPSVKV